MALTLTRIADTDVGLRRITEYSVAFDSSYPTGGESITAAGLGMRCGVLGNVVADRRDDYAFEYDAANGTLIATVGSTGVEVGAGTDLSSVTTRVVAFGR